MFKKGLVLAVLFCGKADLAVVCKVVMVQLESVRSARYLEFLCVDDRFRTTVSNLINSLSGCSDSALFLPVPLHTTEVYPCSNAFYHIFFWIGSFSSNVMGCKEKTISLGDS